MSDEAPMDDLHRGFSPYGVRMILERRQAAIFFRVLHVQFELHSLVAVEQLARVADIVLVDMYVG